MVDVEEIPYDREIDFCTLGMFIIDEIHYLPPTPPVFNIIGGAGAYSALGARFFSPPPLSYTISWVVDRGSDFPPEISTTINSWQTSCILRTSPSRLTTRGWNGYDATQSRAFKYTTPKLRLDASSLTPPLIMSRSFHLCCSPTRCQNLIAEIMQTRHELAPGTPRPIFIWEPVPDLCTPDELLNLTLTLGSIDVLSPNHQELASLMGDPSAGHDPLTGAIATDAVERACEQLFNAAPGGSYALVIRCGARGCYVARTPLVRRKPKKRVRHHQGGLTMDTDLAALFAGVEESSFERPDIEPGIEQWLPPYFGPDSGERVVDPTGGGNGFLGGLAVGLARGKSVLEAAAWGSISASFCIEQVGVPTIGVDAEGRETWNGETVASRMATYLSRPEMQAVFPHPLEEGFGRMGL